MEITAVTDVESELESYRRSQAERWLMRCRKLVAMERAMRSLAETQYEMADNLRGLDYSAVRVTTSPTADKLPDAVARHIEVAETIAAIAEDASERRRHAAIALAKLDDPTEAAALTRYYLEGLTWEQVCVELSYSYSRMMDIRASGLLHAYDAMPPMERDDVPDAV